MLTKLGRTMGKHSEVFNKETEKKKKAKEVTKLKNTVTGWKNMLVALKSSLDEAGEYISKLGNGVVDITQAEYQAKKHSER